MAQVYKEKQTWVHKMVSRYAKMVSKQDKADFMHDKINNRICHMMSGYSIFFLNGINQSKKKVCRN